MTCAHCEGPATVVDGAQTYEPTYWDGGAFKPSRTLKGWLCISCWENAELTDREDSQDPDEIRISEIDDAHLDAIIEDGNREDGQA